MANKKAAEETKNMNGNMTKMRVKLTFTTDILGTASADPEIHTEYIASKAPDAPSLAEEVAAVGAEEVTEKAMTVFPRDPDGKPIFFDYQIRGFFKESAGFLKKAGVGATAKLSAHKKAIDGLVFVKPRMIPITFDGAMGNCQRPLRGQTAQGERIALANSEQIPAGATCEFEVIALKPDLLDMVREWLDYGEWHGMGQWRNSGRGTFTWEEIKG
jgi:hypothetical protein